MLVGVVDGGSPREGAFAPDEGGAGFGEEVGVGVGDHAANVVAYDVLGVILMPSLSVIRVCRSVARTFLVWPVVGRVE